MSNNFGKSNTALSSSRFPSAIKAKSSSKFPAAIKNEEDVSSNIITPSEYAKSNSKILTINKFNELLLSPPFVPPFRAEECPFGTKGHSFTEMIEIINQEFSMDDIYKIMPNENYVNYCKQKFHNNEFYSDIVLSYISYSWGKLKGYSPAHTMEEIGRRQAKMITGSNSIYNLVISYIPNSWICSMFKKAISIFTNFAEINISEVNKNDFSFILSGIPKYDTIGGAYVSKGFFEALLQSTGRVNVETTFKILGVTGSKYVNPNHTHDTHSIFFQTKW